MKLLNFERREDDGARIISSKKNRLRIVLGGEFVWFLFEFRNIYFGWDKR